MSVTSTTNSSPLSSAGIGSGLDVTGMVSKLMAVESLPLTALNQKTASFETQLSAYGSTQSALATLQKAAQALSTTANLTAYSTSAADPSVLAASADSSAGAGNYNISVTSLASTEKLASGGFADTGTTHLGSGTLTLSFGTYTTTPASTTNGVTTPASTSFSANTATTPKPITIDSSNNTLQGVRDAINSAGAGVTASIVNDGSANGNHLVIQSNDTGAKNALQIGVTGSAAGQLSQFAYDPTGSSSTMTETQAASDAVFKVDNMNITKPSNVVTDAIQGVTLNLTKANSTTTLTIAKSENTNLSNIQSFVSAYNAVNTQIKSVTGYNATTNTPDSLTGDSTMRNIQTQMRSLFNTPAPDAPSGSSVLSDFGVTFQSDGSLAVDSTQLSAALNDPNKDVTKLLAGKGYAAQMNTLLGNMLEPSDGLLAERTASINTSMKDITSQESALNVRLAAVQKAYTAEFNNLDTLLAGMNSTSSYLTQEFASIAKSS